MTLKEFFKKFQTPILQGNQKKGGFNFLKNYSLIVYTGILLFSIIIYSTTYKSVNNQKNENAKNLEDFFNSNEFSKIKGSFFETFKSPYVEFSYNIENNDSIGKILKKGDIVVYESTVYPGVTEHECAPVLESESKLKCGKDFFLGYSPERINPGDKEHTFETIIKVVSAQDDETLDEIANVYSSVVSAKIFKATSIKVAEAAKVIENTQRDLNIALINELAILFKHMNIDTHDVLKTASTKWNFLPFNPGLVGGHCIGVDPFYLTNKALEIGYHPEIILAGRRINDGMGKYIANCTIEQMTKAKINPVNSRVAIFGMTFKENCPDLRNTKVIEIINFLSDYGCKVLVNDLMADKTEAKNIYNRARKKILKDINIKKESLEKEIDEENKNKDEDKDHREQQPGQRRGVAHLPGDGEGVDEDGVGDNFGAALGPALRHDVDRGEHLEGIDHRHHRDEDQCVAQ